MHGCAFFVKFFVKEAKSRCRATSMTTIPVLIEQSLYRVPFGPQLRGFLWRQVYDDLARRGSRTFTFMNYGYAGEGSSASEVSDLSAALYDRVVQPFDLTGKSVVEVGSGRGGGAAYLAATYAPSMMLGLDFSLPATELAQRLHGAPNLRFRQGDAGQLPLKDGHADVLVNVESSHCYPSMEAFLAEAFRVLKPGGAFAWCDLRMEPERDMVEQQFEAAGFEVFEAEEITPFVARALNQSVAAKERLIDSEAPRWMRGALAEFAGLPGSTVYQDLHSGKRIYLRKSARKPG